MLKKKKKFRRLIIRRSKINHSITNNNNNLGDFTINYRPQIKHRRIRKKFLNGGSGDNLNKTHIDFKELEQIFDNALRNNLTNDLYKKKSEKILLKQPQSIETRINLPIIQQSNENIKHLKKHQIFFIICFIILSGLIGFFSVFFIIK